MTSFYTQEELEQFGFKYLGSNVKLSRKASIYSPETISIGDNTRIDDFCILSGNIDLGAYIHISAYSALYGGSQIVVENFATISARCTIYSQNDDYSGKYMINSTIPELYTNIYKAPVYLREHSVVAAGCVILPGCELRMGACLGAMSLLKENRILYIDEVWAGIPAKPIKNRMSDYIQYESNLKFDENPYIL